MRLVVVLARGARVRHLAVEQGFNLRSLCGQVQHRGAVPSVKASVGRWDLAVDYDGLNSGSRRLCETCVGSWESEWVPWAAAVRAGVEPPARRASAG